MGNLKTEDTSYPVTLDTATLINDSEDALAEHVNGPVSAILAIESELGVRLKGITNSLADRIQYIIGQDGGLYSGAAFPTNPPGVPHIFYRTDSSTLYIYNTTTATYDVVSTAAILGSYMRNDSATTVTVRHTFNPAVAGAPFTLGANATGNLVTGLNADKVDGYDLNQGVKTTDSPSFVSVTGTTSLIADTIAEKTTATGVTVDGVLLKDGGVTATGAIIAPSVSTDTISEKTATAGVTIDGTLIKDLGISVNTVSESTATVGVTVDGVLLKDSQVTTDVINEKTAAAGVTVDGCLIKDGTAANADKLDNVHMADLAGQPIFDYTVVGSAVTSVTTNGVVTLDSDAHGGYIYQFEIFNNSGSSSTGYNLYINNDTTDAHYNYNSGSSANVGAFFDYITSATGESHFCSGTIARNSVINSGQFFMSGTDLITGAAAQYLSGVWSVFPMGNITRVDIVASVVNSIGIGSRFRLWRRK